MVIRTGDNTVMGRIAALGKAKKLFWRDSSFSCVMSTEERVEHEIQKSIRILASLRSERKQMDHGIFVSLSFVG